MSIAECSFEAAKEAADTAEVGKISLWWSNKSAGFVVAWMGGLPPKTSMGSWIF